MLGCLVKPVSKPWKARVPSDWVDENDDDDDDDDVFDCNLDDIKDDENRDGNLL